MKDTKETKNIKKTKKNEEPTRQTTNYVIHPGMTLPFLSFLSFPFPSIPSSFQFPPFPSFPFLLLYIPATRHTGQGDVRDEEPHPAKIMCLAANNTDLKGSRCYF